MSDIENIFHGELTPEIRCNADDVVIWKLELLEEICIGKFNFLMKSSGNTFLLLASNYIS